MTVANAHCHAVMGHSKIYA